jgi:hypothetical protein
MSIEGIKIDYKHRGPSQGNLIWTKGNTARSYLKNYMMTEFSLGNTPADLVLRGHYHEYLKEWFGITWEGIDYESTLMILPSLCMIGSFIRQSSCSVFSISPGVIAVEIINGKIIKTYRFTQEMDQRYVENIN